MSVLIVVTILEGKQFPAKPKSEIQVSCKFANEILNSDPVSHSSAPYFNTELAWELTKKTLHQHRLQRTPLKLTFYAKSGLNNEEVGHIMLDLRSISNDGAEYKWYPLARSKYKTHKPQIRLMMSTEDSEEVQIPTGETAENKKLFVSLDDAAGCYQVGDPVLTDHTYTLSFTVLAAARLIPLIDESKPAAFCFRFNLLDNLVTNSSFVNAAKPTFPLERVSIKLRGKLENIYKYLASVKDVSLQLCQGEDTVGVTSIPFTKLLTSSSDEEGCVNSLHTLFYICRPNQDPITEGEKPSVEIHFTLQQDGTVPPSRDTVPQTVLDERGGEGDEEDTEEMLAPSEGGEQVDTIPGDRASRSDVTTPPPPRPPATDMQCDLKMWMCNIRLSSAMMQKSGKRYVRYVYPFFGTTAPYSTAPVKFLAGVATSLSPATCEYSFAAEVTGVSQQFAKVPIVLQFWGKGEEGDFLEGTSVISLAPLLKSGLQHLKSRIISNSEDKVIGEVEMSGWLEEKGLAPKHVVTKPQSSEDNPRSEERVISPVAAPERQSEPYKAALELELWKELEQEKFMKELDAKADMRMKQITMEWKRKETEREEEAKRQIAEYNKLKEKMRVALKDLERRESHVVEEERKLQLSQEDLSRERARLTSDMRETSRRVEEEFEHKLSIQKQKLAALEHQNRELKLQVEEAEARLEKRTVELSEAKERHLNAPSTQMTTQLEIIKMEKNEMERKIASLEKAKIHYKDSWTKALKELINVRERAQQDAKRRLHQEQSLMEHARLRYMALEDNKLKAKDKLGDEVECLKDELSKMKDQLVPQKEVKDDKTIAENNTALGRLIEERNSLLNTGVYKKDDPLIQELDNKISLIQNTC